MNYESSYESGKAPYRPDTTRGKWASPTDFIYTGLGLAFKLDYLTFTWLYFGQMGVAAVIPYLIFLALYVVPIMVIQSFMGQFSSSGFISVFRLAPLYKGMGYISIFLNFVILTYYSVYVAVPLLFLVNSLRPTLPWSCDMLDVNGTYENEIYTCNLTHSINETNDEFNKTDFFINFVYRAPSDLFFSQHFGKNSLTHTEDMSNTVSWYLLVCILLTWSIIAGIYYRFSTAEKLGKFIRYSTWATFVLIVICLIRFIFLPGGFEGIKEFFMPRIRYIEEGIVSIPIHVLSAFGPGWGTVITLASFNKFKTNIMRYSWIICIGQMLLFLAFGLMSFLIERHFLDLVSSAETNEFDYYFVKHDWLLYLSSASAMSNLKWPNLWCLLFYGMLSLAGVVVIITQILSLSTTIFDEFEFLRPHKQKLTFGLIGLLSLFSLYFSCSDGLVFFSALTMDAVLTQTTLNLLLLLVVLWIYGRERFQRDIEFMLGQPFATWKVNMLRFVAPICLLFTVLISVFLAFYEHMLSSLFIDIAAIVFIASPWLFIPGYCIYVLMQSTGTFCMRFRRSCRPTDWYPVEMEDRQHYEEAMGNMDITHQLKEVDLEVPST